VRRAAVGDGLSLMVIQLVGREPRWIAAAARLAVRAGAEIVDLNFGCPAKEVTGHLSGSALMRDLDLAQSLVAAAVDAVQVPVTVKMRLGWDEWTRNAPELAWRAQSVGARALTVHGRTRSQFYHGAADWSAIRAVKQAVDIPVVANGDIVDETTAREALRASGADAVMVGRGAIGRPWIASVIEAGLSGVALDEPGPEARLAIVEDHLRACVRQAGQVHGVRRFRKHLARYVEAAPWPRLPIERRIARARLCRLDAVPDIVTGLAQIWPQREAPRAA